MPKKYRDEKGRLWIEDDSGELSMLTEQKGSGASTGSGGSSVATGGTDETPAQPSKSSGSGGTSGQAGMISAIGDQFETSFTNFDEGNKYKREGIPTFESKMKNEKLDRELAIKSDTRDEKLSQNKILNDRRQSNMAGLGIMQNMLDGADKQSRMRSFRNTLLG